MQANLPTPTHEEAAAYIQGVTAQYVTPPALFIGQSAPSTDPDHQGVLIVWAHETYADGYFQVMRWDIWREPDGNGASFIYGEC